MPEYEAKEYVIRPVQGDDQIELIIYGTNGLRWEFGIPYSRTSGRYAFEEVHVLEMDFGEELVSKITAEIEALIETLVEK
jgi:hypothetical protein